MARWYYLRDEKKEGPVEDAQFARLLDAGEVRPSTLIWREGMPDWRPYREVRLQELSGSSLPPKTEMVQCDVSGQMVEKSTAIRLNGNWVSAKCKPIALKRLRAGVLASGVLSFAGFWIRVLARIIDVLFLSVMDYVLTFLTMACFGMRGIASGRHFNSGEEITGALEIMGVAAGIMLVSLVFAIGYETWMTGKFGATFGKMAVGIRVIRSNRTQVTYGRAFGRVCGNLLSSFTFGIGYVIAAFDEEKRALHDHLCDTRVVYNR